MAKRKVKIESARVHDGDRRTFLKAAGATIATVAVAQMVAPAGQVAAATAAFPEARTPQPPPLPTTGATTDVLLRMQEELQLALKKPLQERHWHMVIDLRKCVGCSACTIACVSENKLPPGVVYRPVMDEEIGTFPNVTRRFTPRPCMHCDNPPCTGVCPVNATWKQPDGVVVVDYERCIGCRYCITACPYAARTFDFGETYNRGNATAQGVIVGESTADKYERLPNFEYGRKWPRPKGEASPIGNVRKCHFCSPRVANGILPACVTTCIGRATYFGDANSPESLVSQLVASPNVFVLKEEMGTLPSTYYLL